MQVNRIQVKAIFKNYKFYILILAAFLIALIHVLPELLILLNGIDSGTTHHLVSPLIYNDNIITNWPKFSSVYDGVWPSSDLDLYEYRNSKYTLLWPQLTGVLFLPFLYIFKTIDTAHFFAQLFFSFSSFIILFFLIKIIAKTFWKSLFFAIIVILAPHIALLLLPPSLAGIKEFIKLSLPIIYNFDFPQRSHFLLIESYYPGFIIFGPALISLFYFWRKKTWGSAIILGVLSGLLMHIYSFFYLYVSGIIGILFLILLFKKNVPAIKRVLLSIGINLIITIPYFINMYNLKQLSYNREIFERMALEFGYYFRWSQLSWYIIYIILSIIIYKIGKINKDKRAQVLISMLLVAIGLFNIQLILGYSPPADHWNLRVLRIPLALSLIYILLYCVSVLKVAFWKKTIKILAVVYIVSFISGTIHSQTIKAESSAFAYEIDAEIIESFNFFENKKEDCVILTPSFYTNHLVSVYTPCFIFVPRAYVSLATQQEILERWMISMRLFGASDEDVAHLLSDENLNYLKKLKSKIKASMRSKELYQIYKSNGDFGPERFEAEPDAYLFGGTFASINEDAYFYGEKVHAIEKYRDKILSDYKAIEINKDILKKYRIDYIYNGPQEKQLFNLPVNDYDFLEKIYTKDEVDIYKVNL